ncbi:hypothetical protein METUNv1_01785 [Methyloversatilis universalis FAM5]|uniref:Uncharacterized protein n=1 Tax=Methyloversatilis universalis (strain ATCC BAA-1314 / DSM 25237 / JCM 13912 / CCUG 52030 / FAM5) TaxID=1000565 RepID=F5RBZ0_METUF|nr:hypothetical protein [Methyloversatilis universalis]EGK72007.1 hypothetical protein METUNv1_01785 [Methyloversatilis universalis FAM5]
MIGRYVLPSDVPSVQHKGCISAADGNHYCFGLTLRGEPVIVGQAMDRTLLITWPELVALAIAQGIDTADQATVDAAQAAIDKAAARPAEGS